MFFPWQLHVTLVPFPLSISVSFFSQSQIDENLKGKSFQSVALQPGTKQLFLQAIHIFSCTTFVWDFLLCQFLHSVILSCLSGQDDSHVNYYCHINNGHNQVRMFLVSMEDIYPACAELFHRIAVRHKIQIENSLFTNQTWMFLPWRRAALRRTHFLTDVANEGISSSSNEGISSSKEGLLF